MKIKSLYIAAQERSAGSLFITMGMMELLKRNLHRVAFFRPVISSATQRDGDISFILERYGLDMAYDECYGYTLDEVEEFLVKGQEYLLYENLIAKFKRLEEHYDFVLCEGIRKSFLSPLLGYDLNLKIAQNFGASYINIVSAKEKSPKEIYEEITLENEAIAKSGCSHFASFVNRIEAPVKESVMKLLGKRDERLYFLREVQELRMPTLEDLIESVGAKAVIMGEYDRLRTFKNVKIAALSLENFLNHIEEGDLVIVPADRSEIILALYSALHSANYPNIAAIVSPFSMELHPNITKLIEGLKGAKIPLLSIDTDTLESAQKIMNVQARLRVNAKRKIALALGIFYESIDIEAFEKRIARTQNSVITPQMFEYKLFAMAHAEQKTIVLPESYDERILRAAEIVLRRGVAKIILLGEKERLREHSRRLGLDLEDAYIINPKTSSYQEEFAELFYEKRKAKGISRKAAKEFMDNENYFATMMVECGYADGMVSGAVHTTADTLRPALQIIKTKEGVSLVSSIFFLCFETKVALYGDCALNEDPNAAELCDIAIASAESAKAFGIEAKIAMLSYSTGESGHGADVDKVREATRLLKQKRPDLLVEGPIQYDAAVSKEVARIKMPDSKVAGEATVFIFPDLNSGNNTYKALQRSSGAVAIGPILQGLKKPVNDLSRGALVEDIVNTIAITAIQAGSNL